MKPSAGVVQLAECPAQPENGGAIPARQLHFCINDKDAAMCLVLAHHYSRRWPASIVLCGTFHKDGGLFGNYGEAVAACCFGIPPTRWAEPVLELQRLVRKPNAKTELTQLISLTVAAIKRQKIADLLVSFADKTQGHEGYVYRAACWNYGGCRERRMDGVIVNGVFVPGRSANSRWGTRSPSRLRDIGIEAESHFDEGKHLYWKALNREGESKANRLGLANIKWQTVTK